MIAKNILVRCVKPLSQQISVRTVVLPAMFCLAASWLALPKTSRAVEPTQDLATLASSQLATLEPSTELLDAMRPAQGKPTPKQQAPDPELDLEHIQDLESIVEEARKQAQVEYLAKKLRKPLKAVKQYVYLAWAEAERRDDLSPELLIAIIHKESTFQPKVQSRYGAQGLMQVVRRWHRDKLEASESLFDPAVNIRVGADVLQEYLEAADGNLAKALAKYSGNSRGYATRVLGESERLAKVADMAAAEVVMISWPMEEASLPG